MKTIKVFILLVITLVSMQVSAQTPIQIFETTIEFDKGLRPCIQLNIDPEPNTLKKAWRDYLKDNYKLKLKGIGFLSNSDLLSEEEIMFTEVSSNTMDFYTQIIEDENGSEMKVFVRHGYDIYISKASNPGEYEALREVIESFIKFYLPIYYEGRVDDTENRIKKLIDETKDLQGDITDNATRIDKLKKEIEDLEKELKANTVQLELAKRKLTKRNEKLDRIKNQLKKI